jgi:hypothetical protein
MARYRTKVKIGNAIAKGQTSISPKEYQAVTGLIPSHEYYFNGLHDPFIGIPKSTIEAEPEFYEKIE